MKNTWLIWIFIVGVVATVFFAFNQKSDVPFNDIFPEEESGPVDIEYEFISKDHNKTGVDQANVVIQEKTSSAVESISSIKMENQKKAEPAPRVKEVVSAPPVETTQKEEPKRIVAPKSFKYTVQIASFQKKERADNLVSELKGKNYEAFIMAKDLKDAGIWYRVYAGQFNDMKQAQVLLEKIKKEYKGSFIISPK